LSKPKAVVIGGAGFIGRALTRQLVEAGMRVTVASRSAGAQPEGGEVTYRAANVGDPAQMLDLIEGATVVYDLSAHLFPTWEECERMCVGGARNVAAACLKHGVSRLIFASTISALYMGEKMIMDDSVGSDPEPEKRGFYGRSKIYAEKALLQMHATDKLPVVIIRPGVVLGPGGALVHGAFGEPPTPTSNCVVGFGPGIYPLPCVLVEDVAAAMVAAKDAPGIDGLSFNLAGDVRPSAIEYVEELRKRTKRNITFYPRSLTMARLAEWSRWVLKTITKKPGNAPPAYRDLVSLSMATDLDCSLAKRLLGWKPCSDREEFFRRAIGPHVRPVHPEDLRFTGTRFTSAAR
jgi:nucleoside-diphosphate-sugar epimerase